MFNSTHQSNQVCTHDIENPRWGDWTLTKERRVVVLRRRIRDKEGLIAIASEAVQQLSFLDEADNPIKLYEHVVLVTSLGCEGYELRTIAQLYRDRGAARTALMALALGQWLAYRVA